MTRFANPARKWRRVATADLPQYPPWQNTFALRWEARTWREYSLAGLFPRVIPEYIPDETISFYLRKCAAENRLPWEIFGDLEWSKEDDRDTIH